MGIKEFTILIVEDTKEIAELITLYLEEKYNVLVACTGEDAIDILSKRTVDIVLLDLMLPNLNGYEVMKYMRAKSNNPIIIVSAKSTAEDAIIGLKKGADDYLSKPFNPLELSARVEAQLRRFYKLGSAKDIDMEVMQNKHLKLDCKECCLYKHDNKIILTNIEFKLLKLLMGNPGRIFTKKNIYEKIWEEEYMYDNNSIMVYISKLRDHIEDNSKKPKFITTVRGLGYKFEKE